MARALIQLCLITLISVGTATARAQEPIRVQPAPPEAYLNALRAANVPAAAASFVIRPVDASAVVGPSLGMNEGTPLNPASTMKLLTTYAALNLLGPTYSWRTEVFTSGHLKRDVLEGNLVFRGSGDPKLVVEQLWLLTQRLRSLGLREIRGDVLLDKSAFDPIAVDPAAFDGERFRPYNAGPDALLLNFKAVSFTFVPDATARHAQVIVMPPVAGLKVPNKVRLTDGPCADWRALLQGDFANPLAPQFQGSYPRSCGEKTWHVNVLNHTQYFDAVFRALWQTSGGVWTGEAREALVPADAQRIAQHESEPLAEVIRDINKNSNNVMARQLFLTLGAETLREPASQSRSAQAIRSWLANRGLDMPELVLENGSGLSRIERISPANLARLLAHAYSSPLMPEFMSSLPIVGVDGTMKKRTAAAGNAHIKTGLLENVRAIAGYVHAVSGRRYVVVAIVNHPNASATQPAHDALLEWVFRNG